MQNNYKIYLLLFPNNKVYVGLTKRKPSERWQNGKGYKSQKRISSAIAKYGWENIQHIILYDNLSYHQACEKEIEQIKFYHSTERKFGYNCSTGGEKSAIGFKHTEESKEKIKRNNSRYWLGKKRNKDSVEKMRQALKGNHNRAGKKHTESAKELNRTKHSIPVIQFEGTKVIQKFKSANEAETILNISNGSVTKVCKKKRKTAGGYNWQYAEEWENVQGK